MLMAVVETPMIFRYTTCVMLPIFLARRVIFYIRDVFFRAHFAEWDSILRSGNEEWNQIYRDGIRYTDRCFNLHETEQTNARSQTIFFKHRREFGSWPHSKLERCPTRCRIFINLWNIIVESLTKDIYGTIAILSNLFLLGIKFAWH